MCNQTFNKRPLQYVIECILSLAVIALEILQLYYEMFCEVF